MKSKRTKPAPASTREPAAPRGGRVPNPFPPATRRLAKRLLQFHELAEPDRSRAFSVWLSSAGSPKRNAARQERVKEFYDLIEAIGKKLSPRERESIHSLGKSILAEASRGCQVTPSLKPPVPAPPGVPQIQTRRNVGRSLRVSTRIIRYLFWPFLHACVSIPIVVNCASRVRPTAETPFCGVGTKKRYEEQRYRELEGHQRRASRLTVSRDD